MTLDAKGGIRGVLRLIEAAGGQVDSRIRIQKEAFLLKYLGDSDFRGFNFVFHYHGPYSRGLSSVLQETVTAKLVEESKEIFGNEQVRYSYRLTPEGREWLGANPTSDDTILLNAQPSFRRAHWRALEVASTVVFLERKWEGVDRQGAFGKALELKPDCQQHRNGAETILYELGL